MRTLWYGGAIYTMAAEFEQVEAVLTEGGKIVAAGTLDDLRHMPGEINRERNLHGQTMIPGLVDSHLHLIGHGERLLRLDLTECSTIKEVLQLLQERAKSLPPGEWLIGEGYNENTLEERRILHRFELDEALPNHPVLLKRICRHAMIVNTSGLEAAGIRHDTPNPDGGVIDRDDHNELTGYLLDRAQEAVYECLPDVSSHYLEHALRMSIEDCLSKGLTGGHSEDLSYYGNSRKTFHAFQQVLGAEKTKFRAHLLVHHTVAEEVLLRCSNEQTEFVELGAMKVFADGSLGGRTALLSEHYSDDETTSGVSIHSQQELNRLVKKARDMQMEVAVHAIGDKAFQMVLNAIEEHPPAKGKHDRLIHAQILTPELRMRASKLPVILDIQPGFVVSDFPWVEERLGIERLKESFAWKTLLEEGFHCAGGSDAPIEPLSPIYGIHTAVNRTSSHSPDLKESMEKEKLTVFEAVALYTAGSAYAIHKEHQRGLIKETFDADFTILSRDIFQVPQESIKDITASMTVVAGEIVYKSDFQPEKEPLLPN
ncbi:amidohydrolase family protein [Bacillus lacus]|uniref:Amidohydrolase family protein n=1 Tax=Metabacillus lacus TaxID=1983721 RepID=A0A7X2LZA2_9BACI|nr:amidohydrolase [Metabacillus lacus]MRX71722.1 amidohydrolase family protein [Metabacillus lacus]